MTILVMASSILPMRPYHKNKKGECKDIHAKLHGPGNTEFEQPSEQVPIKPVPGKNVEVSIVFPGKNQDGIQDQHQQPGADRGNAGPEDAPLGKYPHPVNKGVNPAEC